MIKKVILASVVFVVLAVGVAFAITAYVYSVDRPRTDDAVVVSDVILIASRVDGPIVNLAVSDYQRVEEGDLLYEIDPHDYEAALAKALAVVKRTKESIEMLQDAVVSAHSAVDKAEGDLEYAKKQHERKQVLAKAGAVSQSDLDRSKADFNRARAELDNAHAELARAIHDLGDAGEQNAQLQQVVAQRDQAALNLSYTRVVAAQPGHVTNLRISDGTYTKKGDPALTLIGDEWRVVALIRENQLRNIRPGQPAEIYLPAYPDRVFKGEVHGIGWGISPETVIEQQEGLTETSPTLDWVRLAQRFPVQVKLLEHDPETPYRVGLTATVQIDTTDDD